MPIYCYECECGSYREVMTVNINELEGYAAFCRVCGKPMKKVLGRNNFSVRGKYSAKNNYGLKGPRK